MDPLRDALVKFWQKLGHMLSAGVPILQTLDRIARESKDADLRSAIHDIAGAIKEGEMFSDALAGHPRMFAPSVVALVRAGENTGRLENVAVEVANGLAERSFDVGGEPAVEPGDDAGESFDPIKTVTRILLKAVESRASDIHVERTHERLRVRYRVDGSLRTDPEMSLDGNAEDVTNRLKLMAGLDVAEHVVPLDGRIRIHVKGEDLDLRVSCSPCHAGESIVLRVLHQDKEILGLAQQGFSDAQLERVGRWRDAPNGIVIVSGPSGCGKSTTLYSLLGGRNLDDVKVISIEDPIEVIVEGISQMQIRPAAGLTFPAAVRCALRQDPDVLLVGESRDLETLQCCVQAALTGHLVFTTLYTRDASEALQRLLDMGVDPFLISSTVLGIMAQRLVRKVCPRCAEPWQPDEREARGLGEYADGTYRRGVGCEHCHRGYHGRTAIHELLEMTPRMRDAIREGGTLDQIRARAREEGLVPLFEDGMRKAAEGITTPEEVFRVCPRW